MNLILPQTASALVKTLMEYMGFSYEQIQQETGLSKRTLQRILAGSEPSRDTFEKLNKFYLVHCLVYKKNQDGKKS